MRTQCVGPFERCASEGAGERGKLEVGACKSISNASRATWIRQSRRLVVRVVASVAATERAEQLCLMLELEINIVVTSVSSVRLNRGCHDCIEIEAEAWCGVARLKGETRCG